MMTVKLLLPLLCSTLVAGHETTLAIHGSGTTNPSKCYWRIMERMAAMSKIPLRMTYRAIGTTAGQTEFLNDFSTTALADFNSGEIPLDSQTYNQLNSAGIEVIHLPAFLGAVTFFHSIPDTPHLNMTSCLLARIFTRDITNWRHPDLLELNADLPDLDITIARRDGGSSSTFVSTSYMRASCPDHWPADMVGDELENWPTESLACTGSSGMTKCIVNNPGTIGYIDAGHGQSAGLQEIALRNKSGRTLTSLEAMENGGIASAEDGRIPTAMDQDFSSVTLLDGEGDFTWPIVQASFIYVRKNLTSIDNAEEKTLLVAFLNAIYQDVFNADCETEFKLFSPSEDVRQNALTAIDTMIGVDGGNEWFYEAEITPIGGMGDYVLSPFRKTNVDLAIASASGAAEDAMEAVASLETRLATANAEIVRLSQELASFEQSTNQALGLQGDGFALYEEEDEAQVKAALVMSSLSIVAWVLAALVWVVRRGGSSGGVGSRQPVQRVMLDPALKAPSAIEDGASENGNPSVASVN